MDESKKQKIMIGALVVLVAAVLAINFWPSGSPESEYVEEETPVAAKQPKPAERPEMTIEKTRQQSQDEEEAAPTRRTSQTEEEPIKRQKGKETSKDKVVPVA